MLQQDRGFFQDPFPQKRKMHESLIILDRIDNVEMQSNYEVKKSGFLFFAGGIEDQTIGFNP